MRQDLLNKVLIFAAGVTIGSVVTWMFMETKYNKTSEEDFELETEENLTEESDSEEVYIPEEQESDEDRSLIRYNKIINGAGYSGNEPEVDDVEQPYMISPEDFDELDGYKTVTLYWYEDGTLVDELENEIDDPEDIIGDKALEYFNDCDDDSLYVRNDARKTDYEILRG